ncbi:ABC transporter permease [Microbulbifer sp. CNSA002]|uniref:ABC transporter permease n=1 Tax=Microbulbifer sp. CNSA002 TaxID=3373604 RepID=UPI0039B605E9
MNKLALIAHEAKLEIRAGFSSGIVALAFWGLVIYLLLNLVNADYMQKMGATDIPRNSPSLIYLMGAGCMFFQFFAWAWVFSQPILRDRKASLHEVIYTTPNSLSVMLWGRFLGAAVIGAILSASALVGFLVSPVLVWMGLLPETAIGPAPWKALGFAWIWLQIPASIGIGALYFVATLRTRSLAGPFGLAAALMMLWMFAVIVLRGGNINPQLATVMDPSLFTFVYTEVTSWTPLQKSTSLLPFTLGSVLNRILWCLVPLLALAACLKYLRRETLVLEEAAKPARAKAAKKAATRKVKDFSSSKPDTASVGRSLRQLMLEARWRLFHVWSSRAWWVGVAVLVIMGVASSFTQIIWHAEGPMAPRLEMLLPLLKDVIFLVIAFVIAALTGLVCRRDQVPGFDDMLSATPAPDYTRLFGVALTVFAMTVLLALLPGLSGIIAVLLTAPASVDIVQAFTYQLLIVTAPLLELSMMVLLVHALFRHAGFAYSMSMFVTFILVLNHELELVHYPPYEVGITAHIQLSALSGWEPWIGYLLALDGFKVALALLMIGLAALLIPRGLDSRMSQGFALIRSRLMAPQGALVACSALFLLGLGSVLGDRLVVQGGYQSPEQLKQEDALWESYWLPKASGFEVSGGELNINIDPDNQTVEGEWLLHKVYVEGQGLQFELPHGFVLVKASVGGREVTPDQRYDHMSLPVSGCSDQGCNIKLLWQMKAPGWSAEGEPSGLTASGVWLQASDIVPRIGVDPERILRVSAEREALGLNPEFSLPASQLATTLEGAAPSGDWRWQIQIQRDDKNVFSEQGSTHGPLDFSIQWAPNTKLAVFDGFDISHDSDRSNMVSAIAKDVGQMQACVSQRLGTDIEIKRIAQWPRGLGETRASGNLLQLSEGPHWDIADEGTGRWLRRVDIARALARQHLLESSDLRRIAGSAWLSDGVSGAIGLLCVAEIDGIEVLDDVLVRYSDKTTRDLAGSEVPVERLSTAPISGWTRYYAPVAALDWTLLQSPESLSALLDDIKQQKNIENVLSAYVGETRTQNMLGAPLSSALTVEYLESGQIRLDGQRWRWEKGGWQPVAQTASYRLLADINELDSEVINGKTLIERLPSEKVLALDIWPSYQRDPAQNLLAESSEVSNIN